MLTAWPLPWGILGTVFPGNRHCSGSGCLQAASDRMQDVPSVSFIVYQLSMPGLCQAPWGQLLLPSRAPCKVKHCAECSSSCLGWAPGTAEQDLTSSALRDV